MRFPTRLLAANVYFAGMLWLGFLALVAVIALAVAIFGDLEQSAWEQSLQAPRWLALFVGVALIHQFLPLYIAHGQTRRRFAEHAAVTVALYAPVLSAMVVVGYLIEALVYRLAGLTQRLHHEHLFDSPLHVPLVFTEYLVEFLAWTVAGLFMGAAFYRWRGGGLLAVPLGLGLIVLGELAMGGELRLPFLDLALNDGPTPSVVTALLGGAGCLLLGLVMTWPIVRDVPLCNKAS